MTAVVPLRHRYAGVCTSYFPLLPSAWRGRAVDQ